MSAILQSNQITSSIKKDLFDRAKGVLNSNWVDLENGLGYTRPSSMLYPFQWNWDSGFIAYGYCHYNIERAIKEIDSLFMGQWKNGFLPHIIYHTEDKNYFPGYEFWDVQKITNLAPSFVRTSGITQPPMHTLAVWHIYKRLREIDEYKAVKYLEEIYPKIYKLHKYYLTERDPEGTGLVTIYHPWESGFDNSPRWDEPLSNIYIDKEDIPEYERKDIEFVDLRYRPADEDYDKYVYLADLIKKSGYDDKEIYKVCPFKVKDKIFSTILYIANKRLIGMAGILKQDNEEIKEWMRRFEYSFYNILWDKDDRLCYDFDLVSQKRIKVKSADAILPSILSGIFPRSKIKDITFYIDKANFCGKDSCSVKLLPSLDIKDEKFNQYLYWRGPIWINVNWFIWKGLLEYKMENRAKDFQIHMINLINKQGFWEYYSPLTGKGIGAKDFSWTASLAIDLLNHNL